MCAHRNVHIIVRIQPSLIQEKRYEVAVDTGVHHQSGA